MSKLKNAAKVLILFSLIGVSVTACSSAGAPLDALGKVQRLQHAG